MTYEWREAPEGPRYAVLGDPVAHSLSPQMWTAAFRLAGLDETYVRIRVPEDDFVDAVEHLTRLGYRGVNATLPLKAEAYAYARVRDIDADNAAAVNTLRLTGREGWLTDVAGLRALVAGADGPILMLGAGGTARAAASAFWGRPWTVWNRTPEKAVALASHFGGRVAEEPDPSGFAVVLNLTSASHGGGAPPLLWDRVEPNALIADASYRADGTDTPFVAEGRSRGLAVRDGRDMLAAQGALAFTHLLPDCPVPRSVIERAMREAPS